MKTLLDQIAEVKYEIKQREAAIKAWEEKLKSLEYRRYFCCDHEWGKPLKGYEHEGCNCVKCGINDQYAITLKNMKEKL